MSNREELKLEEEANIKLVENFFHSFDTKDWHLMSQCLNDTLELDYESFRGRPKYVSTAAEYIEKRKVGLKGLETKHLGKKERDH